MFCGCGPYHDDEEAAREAELRRVQKRRNKSIDAEIRREKGEYRATHRLLLLGKCFKNYVS